MPTNIVLALMDRIIRVLQLRQTSRRHLMKEHIEPLYNDMCEIVADYRIVFSDIGDDLSNSEISVRDVIAKLIERRKSLAGMREQFVAYLQVLAQSRQSSEVKDFCAKALHLIWHDPSSVDSDFEDPEPDPEKLGRSHIHRLLNKFSYMVEKGAQRDEYQELILQYVRWLEDYWNNLMREYFTLRLEYLK